MNKFFLCLLIWMAQTCPVQSQSKSSAIPLEESRLLEEIQAAKTPLRQAIAHYNLGFYYYDLPGSDKINMDRAMLHISKAKDKYAGLHDAKGYNEAYILMGKVAIQLNDTKLALSLANNAKDTVKVEILIGLCSHYRHMPGSTTYRDTGMMYARQAKDLSLQINDARRAALASGHIAFTFSDAQQYTESENEFLELISFSRQHKLSWIEYYYTSLVSINIVKGDYGKALLYSMESEKFLKLSGDKTYGRTIYFNQGFVYRNTGQFQKCIESWTTALNDYGSKKEAIAYTLIFNIADAMHKLGMHKEALAFVQQKVKENPPLNPPEKTMIATAFGNAYKKLGLYERAEAAFLEVFKVNTDKDYFSMDIFKLVGQFYVEWQKPEMAGPYLRKCLEKANNALPVTTRAHLHFLLYRVDSAAGNYKSAMAHLMKNKELDDIIYSESKVKEIQRLRIKYETDIKDGDIRFKEQTIALLNQQNLLQQQNLAQVDLQLNAEKKSKEQTLLMTRAETERMDKDLLLNKKNIQLLEQESQLQKARLHDAAVTRNIVIGGSAMLLLLLALLYNRYNLKQKANAAINNKNMALQQLVNEKEWLLKEVHHRVKNNLQTIVSLLESQSAYLQADADALLAIQDSQNRVNAMALVHQKLYQAENIACVNMQPYLTELLHSLQLSFNAKNVLFNLQIFPVVLDVSQAIPVGLIVNEAVTNSMKYAFASPAKSSNCIKVSMQLQADKIIELVIADNGTGFSVAYDKENATGLGLKLMRGLTQDIGGAFSITTTPGTSIVIRFTPSMPLNEPMVIA